MAKRAESRANASQRYRVSNAEALHAAGVTLEGATRSAFHLRAFSLSIVDLWETQWLPVNTRVLPDGGWDWKAIRDRYSKEITRFEVAVLVSDRLCGLGIGYLNNTAAVLEAIESDPRDDCPLKGDVLLIVLQALTCYAQRTARDQIWLMEPAQGLRDLYQTVYGFSAVSQTPDGREYCWKRVV